MVRDKYGAARSHREPLAQTEGVRTPKDLFARHHGNLRDALRELYDVYTTRAAAIAAAVLITGCGQTAPSPVAADQSAWISRDRGGITVQAQGEDWRGWPNG